MPRILSYQSRGRRGGMQNHLWCRIICGAPKTLAVKRLMMMMGTSDWFQQLSSEIGDHFKISHFEQLSSRNAQISTSLGMRARVCVCEIPANWNPRQQQHTSVQFILKTNLCSSLHSARVWHQVLSFGSKSGKIMPNQNSTALHSSTRWPQGVRGNASSKRKSDMRMIELRQRVRQLAELSWWPKRR